MSLIYFILILTVNYIAYIFSLHSLTSYLDPEQMEAISSRVSRFSQKYLKEVSSNPRMSLQLTVLIKSLTLALSSLLAVLAVLPLTGQYSLKQAPLLALAIGASWILYLFFLEYLPRRRALRPVDEGIQKYVGLFALAHFVFRPFLQFYNRAFNRSIDRVSEEQKEDIIERAIESLADQAGLAEPIMEDEEKEMIGQIFQLDITEVREVMIPRIDIIGLSNKATIADIRKTTDQHGFSRYPVFDESIDKIIGILYIKDLFTSLPLPLDEKNFDITRYLRRAYFVSETKIISDLLKEFKTNKIHIAIVVDEYGGTAGLVTLEDILEEIVGDIQDEHDYEQAELVKMGDNSVLVDAGLSVDELLEEFDLDYETEEFETIGGLIYDLVGSVPAPGTKVDWREFIFEIEKVEGQRIRTVRARLKENRASVGDAMSD
jgi:putative hemolysin